MAEAATRSARIAEELRDEILRGQYRPGERLPPERQIASRLGVNRSSVREALKRLEQLGLVAIRHGGGATVRRFEDSSLEVVRHLLFVDGELNPAVVAQLLDVYEMLLAGAVRLAVERGSGAELERAGALVARLRDPDVGDGEFVEVIEALMELIAEASGNLVLQLVRNAVRPVFLERVPGLRGELRPAPRVAPSLVRDLETALAARDAASAEEAVRALQRSSRRRLDRALARSVEA